MPPHHLFESGRISGDVVSNQLMEVEKSTVLIGVGEVVILGTWSFD